MMSFRKQRLDKKKEEMIQAAIEVFAEKGYSGATMEDIAAKLFMTKGSVYYYFKDKQDLLFQMQQMLLSKCNQYMQEILQQELPADEKLRCAITTHIEYILQTRASFELMVKPEIYFTDEQQSTLLQLMDEYSAFYDKLIQEGIQQNYFYPVDIKIARNLILGAMNQVLQWYSPTGTKSIKEMAETISEYLMRMFNQTKQ